MKRVNLPAFETAFIGVMATSGFVGKKSDEKLIRAYAAALDSLNPQDDFETAEAIRAYFLRRWRQSKIHPALMALVNDRFRENPQDVRIFVGAPPWAVGETPPLAAVDSLRRAFWSELGDSRDPRIAGRVLRKLTTPPRPARFARLLALAPFSQWPGAEEYAAELKEPSESSGGGLGKLFGAARSRIFGGGAQKIASDDERDAEIELLAEIIEKRVVAQRNCDEGSKEWCDLLTSLKLQESQARAGLDAAGIQAAEGKAKQTLKKNKDTVTRGDGSDLDSGNVFAGAADFLRGSITSLSNKANDLVADVSGTSPEPEPECGFICQATKTATAGFVGAALAPPLLAVGGIGLLLLTMKVFLSAPATPLLISTAGATGQLALKTTGAVANTAINKASIGGFIR